MSARNSSAPVGVMLFLLVALASIFGYMAYALMGPNSPLRLKSVGAAGDAYALIIGIGLPVAAVVAVILYLYFFHE